MRNFVFTALLLFIGNLLQAQQPNIIFITIDDLNDYTEDLGGHPQVETPNLTNIATYGTSFTNAYCAAPQCGPSRTCILSGKDVAYTQVYNNTTYKCKSFRANFSPLKGNAEVTTLPEYLKDNGGYFTYTINKIFHCYDNKIDYDSLTADPCAKGLSWNRCFVYLDDDIIHTIGDANNEGIQTFMWSRLNDSLESDMEDHVAVDTAIQFLQDYADGAVNTCGHPFFLAVGIAKPHHPLYVPESYFNDFYQSDFYELPYVKPYNDPANATPYNGIVMPPQPDTMYNDFLHLGTLAQAFAHPGIYNTFEDWRQALVPQPTVDAALSDSERNFILEESERANAVMAYLAAIKFADAQVGRLFAELQTHPEIFNNTILVIAGDNGFSLGEKKHWRKGCLWETDERVPFIIADLRNINPQVCNRTVSLLDIYPTICDMLGIGEPAFDDGSRYLDGKSLVPLLENPTLAWEKPSLATIKDTQGEQGSCFPQYTVRNERFHYIRYASNNAYPDLSCNEAASVREEELYDIGENRETDPNEWNNLINDPEYAPVTDYLEEFLPGGTLYMQKALSVNITNKTLPCFVGNHTILKLKTVLHDTLGNAIGPAGAAAYQVKWTNSLTGEIFYGTIYSFNTETIPAAVFATHDHILFYVEVTETATSKLMGFCTKTIYINNANAPVASFNLAIDDATNGVDIIDYSITGSYTDTYWTYSDGGSSEDFIPPTHYFAAPGTYQIRNYIEYGNGCSKSVPKLAHITRMGIMPVEMELFPNPATDRLTVIIESGVQNAQLTVTNLLGQIIYTEKISDGTNAVQVDVSKFPAGNYILNIQNNGINNYKTFNVTH